jgi:hypothetical protein
VCISYLCHVQATRPASLCSPYRRLTRTHTMKPLLTAARRQTAPFAPTSEV